MLRLYDFLPSGNGYKVRLLLTKLGVPFELIELDLHAGESRTPEFLARNPIGRVPTLELEDGTCLAESGAILWYLAEGTRFGPETRIDRARTLQWMFFEQYSHEPYIAVLRAWLHEGLGFTPERAAQIPERRSKGYQALDVMETHLADRDWFVGDRIGLADIALYAYTHVAEEGEFDLGRYPAVRRWLGRVAADPGHVPITFRPGKKVA